MAIFHCYVSSSEGSTIVDPWFSWNARSGPAGVLSSTLFAVLYSAIFHPMLFRGAKTIEFRGIKKVEPEPNISECGFKQTFIRNSPTADGFIIWCFEALQPEILVHCFFFRWSCFIQRNRSNSFGFGKCSEVEQQNLDQQESRLETTTGRHSDSCPGISWFWLGDEEITNWHIISIPWYDHKAIKWLVETFESQSLQRTLWSFDVAIENHCYKSSN